MNDIDEARRNLRQAATLIEALCGAGVCHAVVSPGSRNTPIVLALHALAQAGGNITMHSVLDERSAGFFALGLARITGKPTLLSCTSGSAGAHYLPAFVEASLSHVPLIAITADRPAELQGRGAPQTVPQVGMYGPHVRWSFDLATPASSGNTDWLRGIAAVAVDAAVGTRPGPVHINAPFRKPLWVPGDATEAKPRTPQAHRVVRGTPTLDPRELTALCTRLRAAERGCIVWGPDPCPAADPAAIAALSTHLGWPILADPIGPLRYGEPSSATIVSTFDALLRDADIAEELRPDVVLRLGGTSSSTSLSQWMARAQDVIGLDPTGEWRDPEHALSTVIAASATSVARSVVRSIPASTSSAWVDRWAHREAKAAAAIQSACDQGWWSGAIVRSVVQHLPSGAMLHAGSSMPIRDLDAFGGRGRHIRCTANRGANGIDGAIATTFGQVAAWDQGPAVALIGDLTFLHDQGSLMLARSCGRTVVFVVIDNGGGGIFDQLPIATHATAYTDWFRTPQMADIAGLCAAAGVHHSPANCTADLETGLRAAIDRGGATVIHAIVDGEGDLDRRASVWAAVSGPR